MVVQQETTKKEHLITCPYGCGAKFPPDKNSLENHLVTCPKAPKTGEVRSLPLVK